jgi:hypothetical protein
VGGADYEQKEKYSTLFDEEEVTAEELIKNC